MEKNFKKVLALLTIILLMVPSTTINAAATKEPKLNKSSATIYVGKSVKLKMSGTNGSIKWKSSNKKVAKVSSKGKVTGVKKGTATITATVDEQKYTCKVKVKSKNGSSNSSSSKSDSDDSDSDSSSSSSGDVWIPASGSKYHSSKNCSNMKNPHKVTLQEAKDSGYTPCKKCY